MWFSLYLLCLEIHSAFWIFRNMIDHFYIFISLDFFFSVSLSLSCSSGIPMTCMLDISAVSHMASMKVKVLVVHLCPTLCNPMDCSPPGSSVHGILQARNTGVGSHALLQGILLPQGSNPHLLCLLHCRQIFTIWVMSSILFLYPHVSRASF